VQVALHIGNLYVSPVSLKYRPNFKRLSHLKVSANSPFNNYHRSLILLQLSTIGFCASITLLGVYSINCNITEKAIRFKDITCFYKILSDNFCLFLFDEQVVAMVSVNRYNIFNYTYNITF